MENYILLGPQLEASQDRRVCFGEWVVPFMSSLQVCPCIVNDFHKTINIISGEVARERTKTEDKYTGTGLIAHLDTLEAQRVQHSEVQACTHSNKESVHVSHQVSGRDHPEKWTSHIETIWSSRALPLMWQHWLYPLTNQKLCPAFWQ